MMCLQGKSVEMPRIGLEPTCREALDPKSSVSTNFTTWAEKHSTMASGFILIPLTVFVNRKPYILGDSLL